MADFLPDRVQEKLMQKAGVDRLAALHLAIDIVRRGGTISLAGVYGGMADPMPMMTLFDKQVQLRMGQANVRRWTDDILPLLTDDDPLGVDGFATHHLPLARGARRLRQLPEEGRWHGEGRLPPQRLMSDPTETPDPPDRDGTPTTTSSRTRAATATSTPTPPAPDPITYGGRLPSGPGATRRP